MLQSNDCNVVVCRDSNCKLCSTSSTSPMQDQAYIVYTCESTKCRLCREETDVLLDLFCPFNTVENIAEMTRKLNNITEAPWRVFNDGFTAMELQNDNNDFLTTDEKLDSPNLQSTFTQSCENSQTLRAVLQSTPGQLKDIQGTTFEIISNLQPVDESLLTDLERELKVDELEDLPELKDVGIYDFISR